MTIGEFLPLYEQNHVINIKSWRETSRRLHRHIAPLGSIQFGDLKRMQVITWHQEIGRTRGHNAANLALQQLHSMYVKAVDWEVYDGRNPADRIKKFPKYSRARFVQSNELPYLLSSFSEELAQGQAFFLLLLFTGCRVGEAQSMKWADLDLERALWHKPTTKTGVPHTIPLPKVIVERILGLPRVNEWVFVSRPNHNNGWRSSRWCRTSISHMWYRIRKRAGLPDLRIHDLRRTCASWLAINGENLPVIQQTLNHASLQSTQIYARLSVAPVRRALDEQAERMLQKKEPAPHSREPQNEEWPG